MRAQLCYSGRSYPCEYYQQLDEVSIKGTETRFEHIFFS